MMSKNFDTRFCLSVCLSVTNFDPNYLRTGKTEWAKNNTVVVYFDQRAHDCACVRMVENDKKTK